MNGWAVARSITRTRRRGGARARNVVLGCPTEVVLSVGTPKQVPAVAGGMDALDRLDRPAWVTAGATLVSYGLVLLVLFALLFVVPYLVFAGL